MSRKISAEKKRAIRDLGRTGRTQREIAEIVGVSKGTVSGELSWNANHRAAPRPRVTAPTLPEAPALPTGEETRARIRATLCEAAYGDHDRASRDEAALQLYRFDHPQVAEWLDTGVCPCLASALMNAEQTGDALRLLHKPADLAWLALYVCDDDDGPWGREDGETEEDFARALFAIGEAAHARGVALLEEALAIVKATPVADCYRVTAPKETE